VLLEDKNAVIYGGGGSIGGAAARAFAREGARVFLAGRTPAKLEAVAEDIRSASDPRVKATQQRRRPRQGRGSHASD
jgi:NAD(P)-dependent dehydrogenase (short-subunit alcohol dehydrogenase family)